MERQEEKDRRNIFLMGSNTESALPNDSYSATTGPETPRK